MKERAKPGDIFTQQLENGKYMFGKVLMDVETQCFQAGKAEFSSSGIKEYEYCVQVFDAVLDTPEFPKKSNILIQGIGVCEEAFENDLWEVIGFNKVHPSEVDFQESISYDCGDLYFSRGELWMEATMDEGEVDEVIENLTNAALIHSEILFDLVFEYIQTEDQSELIDYDARFLDNYSRKKIYDVLKEDSTMSYFDLALKHGFDCARFFDSDDTPSTSKASTSDQTRVLNGIAWSFIGEKFANASEFEKALTKANIDLSDDPVLHEKEVTIYCEYIDEDDHDHELEFNLTADNGESLSGKELLLKIHNRVVEALDDNDYHFFEGLTLISTDDSLPTYMINLGN